MPICRAGRIVAEDETRRTARLLVDLPGPKLRTGPLAAQTTSDRKGDYLRLRIGDRLLLTRADDVAGPEQGEGLPAQIGCSLPEAFAATRRAITYGSMTASSEASWRQSIETRSSFASPRLAQRARSYAQGRGSICPTPLWRSICSGPTARCSVFAAECADIVGLSFVSRAREVQRVNEYLDQHGRPEIGMILKIETRRAFEHLPGMLLAALGCQRPAGVMIARGDLAVECGYERLAEVQGRSCGFAKRRTSQSSGPRRCSISSPRRVGPHGRRSPMRRWASTPSA